MITGVDVPSLARKFEGYTLLLQGPNGSGKGTQVKRIKEDFSSHLVFPSISMGEKLREIADSGSEIARKIKPYLDAGQHVPNDLVYEYVIAPFFQAVPAHSLTILDGFPRNEPQVYMLAEIAKKRKFLAIVFEASDETCLRRTESRIKSGSTRSDDNLQTARDRLKQYRRHQPRVVRALRQLRIPILTFDAEGDEVYVYYNLISGLKPVVEYGFPKLEEESRPNLISIAV